MKTRQLNIRYDEYNSLDVEVTRKNAYEWKVKAISQDGEELKDTLKFNELLSLLLTGQVGEDY